MKNPCITVKERLSSLKKLVLSYSIINYRTIIVNSFMHRLNARISSAIITHMPAIQRSEFALALNQVATERGVDAKVVLDTVKSAILAAYRKDNPEIELEEYEAELNQSTGEAKILHQGKDVTPPGFGRIAAQTAKQVILQQIREKEKEAIISDYKIKMGTVVAGMVLRFAGPNIIVDIGKAEALMPPSEQVGSDKYYLNQRLSFYLVEIREGTRGEEVIVSRAHTGLIEGLFRREVPEVASGSVEVRTIVREAGTRTKMAVFSDQPGIDPVGSCVGQKGVRVQAVLQEVNGEKIDIIQWTDDNKSFITQALAPAKDVTVTINEEEKTAKVTVPEDQLSLAIGKDGQNVRLASKLTGYRIEIEGAGLPPVEEKKEEVSEEPVEEVVESKPATEKVEPESETTSENPKEEVETAVETVTDASESTEEAPSTEEVAPETPEEVTKE